MRLNILRLFTFPIAFGLSSNFAAHAVTFDFLYSGQNTGLYVTGTDFSDTGMGSFSYSGMGTSVSLSNLNSFQFSHTISFTFINTFLSSTYAYGKGNLLSFTLTDAGLSLITQAIPSSDGAAIPAAFSVSPPRTQTTVQTGNTLNSMGGVITTGPVTLIPPTLKLQGPVVDGATITTELVDAQTGEYNPLEISLVAKALGYSSFDYIQTATFEINGQPFTATACLNLYASAFCTNPARTAVSYDTRGGLISKSTAASHSQTALLYGTEQGLSKFFDQPCYPAAITESFTDELVGVTSSGEVSAINSPLIEGDTNFSWQYVGSSLWTPTTCHELNPNIGISTVSDASNDTSSGVGTAIFTGFISSDNLAPDIKNAFSLINTLPTNASVPEIPTLGCP